MLDVFLPGPDDLDRRVDMLSDLDGADYVVALEPPAKTTADEMVVHDDLVQRQPGGLRRRHLDSG